MNIQLKSSLLLTNIIENYDNAITIYDRKKTISINMNI